MGRKKTAGKSKSVAPIAAPVGGTQSSVAAPTAAIRGVVQKTFIPVRILSGFTDQNHLEQLTGEYLATLGSAAAQKIRDDAEASRQFVATLSAAPPGPVVVRQIQSQHIAGIQSDPLFQESFGRRQHQFAMIDVRNVIAQQPWIEPRADPIPADADELIAFALPNNWEVPAEVSFIPPQGPIQILTSSPSMQGVRLEFDAATATVKLGAPKHLNLVQVTQFAGRYFLMNGYHRVTDAIAAGTFELPALVTEGAALQDIQLPGVGPFSAGFILSMPRPPLVSDFGTAASLLAKIRERRYGMMIDLTLRQLVIGI